MTDDIMDRARRVDPVAPTEFDDWSNTPQGRGVFAKIVAEREAGKSASRFRGRRLILPATASVAVLAAAGYAVTSRDVETPSTVACASTFSQTGDMTIVERPAGQPATATCISEMREAWNPPPTNPVECVTSYPGGEGGALLVVPAPDGMTQEEACAAIGAAVPEDEG